MDVGNGAAWAFSANTLALLPTRLSDNRDHPL
jgi:hypothetical protein